MLLRHATLAEGQALLAKGVRESWGPNWSPIVQKILAAANVHAPAPWCMATVTFCSNNAAEDLGRKNPLDAVLWEASVDSLVAWVDDPDTPGRWVAPHEADAGDLAVYNWTGDGDWDHIGIVAKPPGTGSAFAVVEGNHADQMELVDRWTDVEYDVRFARWDELPEPEIEIQRVQVTAAEKLDEIAPVEPLTRPSGPHAAPHPQVIRADADPSAVETAVRWTTRLLPVAGSLARVLGRKDLGSALDAVSGVVGQITGRR